VFGKIFYFSGIGLFIVMILILSGCEGPQGPTGPAGTQPLWIEGYIVIPDQALPEGSVYTTVLNCPVIPSVRVNDLLVAFSGHGFHTYDFPIEPGQPVELAITYIKPDNSQGFAGASIVLPGRFEITSHNPDSSVSLPKDSSLVVAWSASEHATSYKIYCSISYRYGDFADSIRYEYFSIDTLISETSLTIPAERIFPNFAEMDTLEHGSGSLNIYAISGPVHEGNAGNVMGDGTGFFNGWTYGDELDIEIVD
jgi:hypothetical protein